MPKKNDAGKYRGRVQIGNGPDGKPINKYVCAATQRELEALKEEVRKHYIEGEPLREDMPFHEYAEEWYRLKKAPVISEASRVYYRSCFTKHILPAFGMRHLRAIRSQELQEYINGYAQVSKSKITLVLGILHGIFEGALADGIIERDPSAALVRPKAKKKDARRALTAAETQNVLQTMARHKDGDFLAVLYYMGLRRGEALGLKWGDFDWDDEMVHIERDIDYIGARAKEGALKTLASDRYVPITDEIYHRLKAKREMPDMFVFHTEDGSPIPQATFQRMWLSLMLDAGCTVEREQKEWGSKRPNDMRYKYKATITPHYLRHNFVTMLYEAEIDPLIAMKLVGHTDYQTTANIYTHLKDEALKRASCDLSNVFKDKKLRAQLKNLGK